MGVQEFEGKNEREAINNAIQALGLNKEDIDIEVVESKKGKFIFGGGKVRIRVHIEEDGFESRSSLEAEDDFESEAVNYVSSLIEKIGMEAKVHIAYREERKIGLDIETDDSGLLIGKRGKTLEALQLITNIAAGRMSNDSRCIIIDTEDYRSRRESSLVRFAQSAAEQVRRTGQPRLLEAMNPFERRLVHTALGNSKDVETISEGDGRYKRIRIYYRNSERKL